MVRRTNLQHQLFASREFSGHVEDITHRLVVALKSLSALKTSTMRTGGPRPPGEACRFMAERFQDREVQDDQSRWVLVPAVLFAARVRNPHPPYQCGWCGGTPGLSAKSVRSYGLGACCHRRKRSPVCASSSWIPMVALTNFSRARVRDCVYNCHYRA